MNKINLDDTNNRYIIAGMLQMIENEGMTVEQVYERIEEIKRDIHFALVDAEQIAYEKRRKSAH